jgi:murein DD-endopeptidase MepM/ murein hydrolase activator NlpD
MDSQHPSKDVLDENQRLGCNYGGANNVRCDHTGIDLDCNEGDPVYATYSGTVTESERRFEAGEVVRIRSTVDGRFVAFAHLLTRAVPTGAGVQPGTLIGYCNATGIGAQGNHLHYEVQCPDQSNCFLDPESNHPCMSE